MRSGILRTRVKTLRLRRDAPWPSQLFELDSQGRRWRYIFKAAPRVSALTDDGVAGPHEAQQQLNDTDKRPAGK